MFKKKNTNNQFDETADIIDSWLDSVFYRAFDNIANAWSAYSSSLSRWHISGYFRVIIDLVSDAATFGTVILFMVLYFAVPPIKETEDIWHKGRQYAVTFKDSNNNIIGRRGIRQNDAIPLENIPPMVINALLATEDRRFFTHIGIDFVGTARAMVANVRARHVVQGGSTLTQQLAKNLFLSPDRTIKRKLYEAMMAIWIEQRKTKSEILKLYLDRAYMGGGAYGVEAAAQFYFGKSIRNVNLSEAAMLAGLFKAPSSYAPHVNLKAARARASVVLGRMVVEGFITQGEAFAARRSPAKLFRDIDPLAPNYFLDWAYERTIKTLKKYNLEKEYVIDVVTTIDMDLQRTAKITINDTLDLHDRSHNVHQAALVSMTPKGAVIAMVGGRDYERSQFNRATKAKRQPGSSFKPVVYLTALRNGYRPGSIVVDRPITIGKWSPRNYTLRYRGPITLKTALTKSINTIPVRLSLNLGRKKIIETARALGWRSRLISTPSLPLGTSEVNVLELTSIYAVLANGGKRVSPYTIEQIRRPSGELLYARPNPPAPLEQVFKKTHIADLVDMMHNAVVEGTGRSAFMDFMPAAGKTGTTSSYRDAWFMGFTNYYVTGIWYGNDNYRPMKKVTGGSLPARTWRKFMVHAHKDKPIAGLPGVAISDIYHARNPQEPKQPDTLGNNQQAPSHRATIVLNGLTKLFRETQIEIEVKRKPVDRLSTTRHKRQVKRSTERPASWSSDIPTHRFSTTRSIN